ncbi:hypothetical protein LZ190_21160 [Rhodovulum sulfidophilum]|nr:hypothetical protein [Rhodovulum sulfidophilum]
MLLEQTNLELALELMEMAQRARPDGPFINARVEKYQHCIEEIENRNRREINRLVTSGELAIIPAGFRCFTKAKLKEMIGLSQPSLPFDSGFFPPESIAKILSGGLVELKHPDPSAQTHQVCIKTENSEIDGRKGISFTTSSYEEINQRVRDQSQGDINSFLDATFGYYTFDKSNGFVLAHYNWHKFAESDSGARKCNPAINLKHINKMLNHRIERMFEMCKLAKHIVFVLGETQGYSFMSVDEKLFEIMDTEKIFSSAAVAFGGRVRVLRLDEVNTATKILSLLAA